MNSGNLEDYLLAKELIANNFWKYVGENMMFCFCYLDQKECFDLFEVRQTIYFNIEQTNNIKQKRREYENDEL